MLNALLQSEVKDPRLEDVRVNEVELSGDLGVATVFYSTLDPDSDPEPVKQAIAAASGFLRLNVGRQLRLRRVPELRFRHDQSARQGLELTRLIDSSLS